MLARDSSKIVIFRLGTHLARGKRHALHANRPPSCSNDILVARKYRTLTRPTPHANSGCFCKDSALHGLHISRRRDHLQLPSRPLLFGENGRPVHLTCTGSADTLCRIGELLACGVIDVALKAHHTIRRIGTTGRLRLRVARDNRMARRFVCRGLLDDEGTQDARALIGALAGTQAHALYPEALRKGLFRM